MFVAEETRKERRNHGLVDEYISEYGIGIVCVRPHEIS